MSMERSSPPLNKQIIDEAAEWFVEINEGEPDAATRQQFDAWLRRSPEHVRAYLRVLPVWEDGARLDAEAGGDPQALIVWARAGSNVVSLDPSRSEITTAVEASESHRKTARPASTWRVAVAASVACLGLAAALVGWLELQRRSIYETGIGEQRVITLTDGSVVELNSRSKLKVHFTEGERAITLLAGQALFEVAKDASRPFTVRSGDAFVRAVGTQFDVYRKRTGTIVTVVEGRVAILPLVPVSSSKQQTGEMAARPSSVVLSAGEQAILTPSAPPKARRTDVAIATAWTQRRLQFSRTPLADVAEEFNRYNERQLIVLDDELQAVNVSGSFSSADPASLLRFLRAQPGIKVSESESMIYITGE
jgi:transmembrane sensor